MKGMKKLYMEASKRKMLWIEFKEPILDERDNYFVFLKSYAPDPLLISSGNQPVD